MPREPERNAGWRSKKNTGATCGPTTDPSCIKSWYDVLHASSLAGPCNWRTMRLHHMAASISVARVLQLSNSWLHSVKEELAFFFLLCLRNAAPITDPTWRKSMGAAMTGMGSTARSSALRHHKANVRSPNMLTYEYLDVLEAMGNKARPTKHVSAPDADRWSQQQPDQPFCQDIDVAAIVPSS